MSYITCFFNLAENQKNILANAYNNKKAVNIKFKFNQLTGDIYIMITKRLQIKSISLKQRKLDLFLELVNHRLGN